MIIQGTQNSQVVLPGNNTQPLDFKQQSNFFDNSALLQQPPTILAQHLSQSIAIGAGGPEGNSSSYNATLSEKLDELRKIPEFAQAETDTKKRWNKDVVFQIDTGDMSNSNEYVVSINPNDLDLRYKAYREPELPESIAQLEKEDEAKFWEAYDKWEAENFTRPFSWERLLTHELMHSAYGTTNAMINDHYKIINKTNEIMGKHYNEVDRHPYINDGI